MLGGADTSFSLAGEAWAVVRGHDFAGGRAGEEEGRRPPEGGANAALTSAGEHTLRGWAADGVEGALQELLRRQAVPL